jgi:hypothetical protein
MLQRCGHLRAAWLPPVVTAGLSTLVSALWLTALVSVTIAAPPPPTTGLTEQDRALDCPGLRTVVADTAFQLKKAEAAVRKANAAPASSVQQLFQRQTAAPTPADIQVKALQTRAEALAALSGSKGCDKLDGMTKSRLGAPLIKPVDKPAADRCNVRGELALQDCVEDIAQWRCRADQDKGATYVVCLDRVAEQVIRASGFDSTTLAHFDPGCVDPANPATCSVFADDRTGPETKWCKRLDEANLEVCEPPKGPQTVAAADKTGISTPPVTAAAVPLPVGTACKPEPCKLGTCNRLCGPPQPAVVAATVASTLKSTLTSPRAPQKTPQKR